MLSQLYTCTLNCLLPVVVKLELAAALVTLRFLNCRSHRNAISIVATCNMWPSLIQARNSGNLSWVKAILLFLQCRTVV